LGFVIYGKIILVQKLFCKMLVKLTDGVNFTNILQADFLQNCFCTAFLSFWFCSRHN
jgi:hypothetical protein